MPDEGKRVLDTIPLLASSEGDAIVHEVCEQHELSPDAFYELVKSEMKHQRDDRRGNNKRLYDNFDEVFDTAVSEESEEEDVD